MRHLKRVMWVWVNCCSPKCSKSRWCVLKRLSLNCASRETQQALFTFQLDFSAFQYLRSFAECFGSLSQCREAPYCGQFNKKFFRCSHFLCTLLYLPCVTDERDGTRSLKRSPDKLPLPGVVQLPSECARVGVVLASPGRVGRTRPSRCR